MIKYNPLFKNDGTQNGALTTAPSDSIIFDLPGKCIWVKGVKLKGTDTTYTFSHDDYITLANTPGDPEDIKIGVDTTALKNAIDTTYGVVSATVDGLAPKYSLGNKTTTDFYTSLYCLGVVGSTLKWYQIPHRTVRINSDATDRLTSNDGEPLRISAGTNIGVTWDSTNKSIVISNTATIPVNTDSNVAQYLTSDNNDYRILFKGTVNNESEIWSTKFASTLLYNPSTKTLKIDGNAVLHAGNVNNADATIGTSLTTIATIGGVDIKAKIASYSLSDHTHPLSIAADSGTSSIALAASTKYKLTAGGSTYVFTSTPDENVKLVDNNNNENVPILLKNGTGTDTITSSVRTVDGITVNPSTNSLSINGSLNVGGGSRISGLVQLRQLASDTLAWIEVYSNDWSTRYGWLGTSWETSTLLWNGYTIYHSGNLPAYPTVNNASLTLQVRETTLTTFYANDSTNRIFNVTNALLGNSISWDTVTINDTGRRFVRSIYNSTSNLNEFALYGNAIGMESLGDNGSNDNPGGYTGWHHIFLATWVDTREVNGSTTNEWCTQIANRCGTTDLWVRSRSGGSISNGTAWGANWTRILTGSNWTDVITLPTVNNASLTLLTAGNTQTTFYANDSTDKIFNVTCDNIGAATSSHNHDGVYLPIALVSVELNTDTTWGKTYAESNRQSFVYNTSGREWAYWIGMRSSDVSYGTILRLSHDGLVQYAHKAGGAAGANWSAWKDIITSDNIGLQSVNYATNATRLYASDSPYRYGDSAPYYAYFTYNDYGDGKWYMRVSPATPAAIRVDYATSATTAYSPYGFSFSDRSSSDWTGVPGTFITDWSHSGGSGADIMFKYNGGALNVITDGYFYQGIDYKGASYRVLDEYDISNTKWGDADTLDGYHASSFSLSGHTHNSLHGDDNRSVNNNPAWYMTNVGKASIYTEFCMSGGAVSDSYENRTTFTPWGDSSGQRPVQLAFNNSGMFIRTSASDTDWNVWNTIVHSGNVTNSNTTLTTSLLTIATIAGVEIKAAITNYNTDFNVQQTPKTDNVNRPLMMINGGTTAGELTTTSMFSTSIYANASTNMITANGFVKAGSDNTYVLLGGGGHELVSNLSSLHQHYIGTTLTQSNSAIQNLTGIAYIELVNTSSEQNIDFKQNSNYRNQLSANETNFVIWSNTNGSSGWRQDLVIKRSDGSVGIGTASPVEKLHVNGYVYLGSTALNNTAFTDSLQILANSSNESYNENFNESNQSFGITFIRDWETGGYRTKQGGIYSVGSGSWRAGLAFRVKNNTTANGTHDTTAMWISPVGNIGIGTVSPSAKLDVRSADGVSMSMDTANEYRFATSFKGTIHIANASWSSGNGVNDGYTNGITFGVNAAAFAGIFVQNSGWYGSRMVFTTTDDYSYNKARMILDATGKLGIGTMTPTNKLTVEDVGNDSVPTLLTKSTRDGSWVYGASFLAPNLTNGHNIYVGLGKSHGTRNYFGITHYHYGDGSTSNYAAVEIYGIGNIQRWYYGDLRTWFAGRVDSSGFYHNSYGSSAYVLTSDGGAAHIGSMSVNYANYAGYLTDFTRVSRVSKNSDNNEIETVTGWQTSGFIQVQRFCPPEMYRTTEDMPAPYGIGFGNGSESGGIMPIGSGDYLQELRFYGANSGPTIFTFGRQIWEGSSYDNRNSNRYETYAKIDGATGRINTVNSLTFNDYAPIIYSSLNSISGYAGEMYFGGNFHIDSVRNYALYLNYCYANDVSIAQGGGKVGVGQLGGAYKFNVIGTSYSSQTIYSGVSSSTDLTHIPSDSEVALATGNGNGSVSAWIWRENYSSSNWGIFHDNSTDYIHFVGNNTARLSIDLGGGNVGVGTTSPQVKLHVSGPLAVIDDSSNNGYDGLAYFRHYSNNDWGIIIDKNNSYDYGLDIRTTGSYGLRNTGGTRLIGSTIIGADATPGYTLDVRGTAYISDYLRVTGGIARGNEHILSPAGGSYTDNNSSVTGYIIIRFPQSLIYTMMSVWIDVYSYSTNESFTIQCGGYTYDNSFGHAPFAMCIGAQHKVRYCYDADYYYIVVGESNTGWSYPKFMVRDMLVGFSKNVDNWIDKSLYCYISTSLPGTEYTSVTRYAITTDNISSQSVNYANYSGYANTMLINGTTAEDSCVPPVERVGCYYSSPCTAQTGDAFILAFNTNNYIAQLAIDVDRTNKMAVRMKTPGNTWTSWASIITSDNIGSQSVNYANSVAWTGVTAQMQGGNEFNIPDSGYPHNSFWINYLPRNSRSANGTLIADYHFGNLGAGYANLTAAGFKKSGSDDTYVLLGGGGHKALSDFSMAHSHPYLPLAGGTMDNGAKINFDNRYGTNYIGGGTDDGASFTTYNIAIGSWYGFALVNTCTGGDRVDGASWYCNVRYGHTELKGISTAQSFISNVATGTQPYACSSTTCNTNLNADLLDGYHESSFFRYRTYTETNGDGTLWSQNGVKQYNNALPDGLTSSGSYNYGSVVTFVGGSHRLELWSNHGSSDGNYGIAYRTGWDNDKKPWARLIDSNNIGSQSVDYANRAGTISGLSNNSALIDWSSAFGESNEYNFSSPGLRIGQWNDESSGIVFTGDGIYMWAPPDNCSLAFYNDDDGSEIWSINGDGYFSGSCNYANSATSATYSLNLRGNTQIANLDSGTMYNRIYWHDNNATGNPSSGIYGNLLVISNNSTTCTPGTKDHWIQQIDFTHDNKIWHRQRVNNGAWSSWEVVLTSSNYSNYISGGSVSMSVVAPIGTDTTYRLALTSSYNGSVSNLYCISGLYANSNGVYYSSDINLKTDIKKFFLNQELIENPIKAFRWKNTNSQAVGFIAQEVQNWCPEAVLRTEDNTLTVNYNVALSALCGVLYNRIKELEETVKNLQNQINTK